MSSTQYPGYTATAVQYWRRFFTATLGIAVVVAITGGLGAFAVFVLLPEASAFYLYAAIGLTVYLSGVTIASAYKGEYDPKQTEISSPIHLLALIVVLAVWIVTVLLIATLAAYVLHTSAGVSLLAVLVAVFYPIVDILAQRHALSPGGVAVSITVLVISTIVDIHRSLINPLLMFDQKRNRPS